MLWENKSVYDETMTRYVKMLDEIIDRIKIEDGKMTNSQKIQFAVLAYNFGICDKLEDIFRFITIRPVKPENVKCLIFLGDLGYKNTYNKNKDIIQLEYKAKFGYTWIKEYDIEADFKASPSGTLPTYKILIDENNYFTIDKEIATEIINILIENGIPLITCIVREAFRRFANGKLEEFNSEISSQLNFSERNNVKTLK